MNEVLRFENVSKSYSNGVRALRDVNISIKKGEFISVIGPSGAGKSTFLRSINGLNSISYGKIYFDGKEITGKRGKELRVLRRKIGMIFQNYNLVYRLSVLQNVLHGRLGYRQGIHSIFGGYLEEDKEKAVQLIEELGLDSYAYTRAGDLSGGQKQRVGIARAIIQQPDVLLCDEPIASLDPSSSKTIMDMLKHMTSSRGITCIANLHQVDVAKRYSTRIIGLREGTIVFDGKPENLTEDIIAEIYGTDINNLIDAGEKEYA